MHNPDNVDSFTSTSVSKMFNQSVEKGTPDGHRSNQSTLMTAHELLEALQASPQAARRLGGHLGPPRAFCHPPFVPASPMLGMMSMQLECASAFFDGAVRSYRFPRLADERGWLTPVDLWRIPFTPVRAFLVEAPAGVSRGGHGHTSGQQLLMRVSGRIFVEVALGDQTMTIMLDETDSAILIKAPVWSRQTYCIEDARLLVFCDTPYDPASYIRER